MARILIIDDDALVRKSLYRLFQGLGHDVLLAENLFEGLAQARTGVDVVYLDLDLPDGDGLSAIHTLGSTTWKPEVIVITGMQAGYGAEQTLQSNAWDYLTKPASPQKVKDSLESALRYREESAATTHGASDFDACGIISKDNAMRQVLGEIERAAKSDASVLISGETGVGKELAARAIHANSNRSQAPFVVVDCSNLTETLVESVLYGHVKGAFTGAHADRDGLVAQADGGTLFLDEVGELPLAQQKSFLRVLQERLFRPVGSGKERFSDFRVVAATNRDLENMVREGEFRSDLLFRIRTVEIVAPPLRERGGDASYLAAHFIDQFCDRYGLEAKSPSKELGKVLKKYHWPGNVRELSNVMEAAVIHAGEGPVIYPKHLSAHVRLSFLREQQGAEPLPEPEAASKPAPSPTFFAPLPEDKVFTVPTYAEYKAERDGRYFARLLEHAEYNIRTASELSGLSVPSVYRHLALAGISPKNGKKLS